MMIETRKQSKLNLLYFTILATIATSFYLYITQQSTIGTIGGFTVHITDLLFGLVIVCCLAAAVTRWRFSAELILLLFCILLLFSFIRGVLAPNATNAGVEFRIVAVFIALVCFVYFWGPVLDTEWIFGKIVWLGWAIVALAIAREMFGFDTFILEHLPPDYEFRALNAPAALMLGEAALISVNNALEVPFARRSYSAFSAVCFLSVLYFSHQRTATFATVFGLAIIFSFSRTRFGVYMSLAGTFVFVAGLFLLMSVWVDVGSNGLVEYIPDSIAMVIYGAKTFGARELAWNAYLYNFSTWPWFEQLIGRPFGVPIFALLTESLSEVSISPHNGYIIYLLRVGFLGVAIFIVILAYSFGKGLYALLVSQRDNPLLRLAVAFVGSHAIYSVGYLLPNEQGLLLAIAVQTIARKLMPGPQKGTSYLDSRDETSQIQKGERRRFAMARAIGLRDDFDAAKLRQLATKEPE